MTITPLTIHDTNALTTFFAGLSQRTIYFFHPHPFDSETAQMLTSAEQLSDPNKKPFIATENERIIGYVFLHGYTQPIPSIGLCIADDQQGKGIGGILLRHVMDYARSDGKTRVQLTTMQDNLSGQKLYQRHGFEVVGIQPDGDRELMMEAALV